MTHRAVIVVVAAALALVTVQRLAWSGTPDGSHLCYYTTAAFEAPWPADERHATLALTPYQLDPGCDTPYEFEASRSQMLRLSDRTIQLVLARDEGRAMVVIRARVLHELAPYPLCVYVWNGVAESTNHTLSGLSRLPIATFSENEPLKRCGYGWALPPQLQSGLFRLSYFESWLPLEARFPWVREYCKRCAPFVAVHREGLAPVVAWNLGGSVVPIAELYPAMLLPMLRIFGEETWPVDGLPRTISWAHEESLDANGDSKRSGVHLGAWQLELTNWTDDEARALSRAGGPLFGRVCHHAGGLQSRLEDPHTSDLREPPEDWSTVLDPVIAQYLGFKPSRDSNELARAARSPAVRH